MLYNLLESFRMGVVGGNGTGAAGCTHKYKNVTLSSCNNCATWKPGQQKPTNTNPYADCGINTIGHCFEGCEYAFGAPPKPVFPLANETVCACESWGKVACDGGVKGRASCCLLLK